MNVEAMQRLAAFLEDLEQLYKKHRAVLDSRSDGRIVPKLCSAEDFHVELHYDQNVGLTYRATNLKDGSSA